MNTDNLPKRYMEVAAAYTRQFERVIGYYFDIWIGATEGMCGLFGDYYCFTIEQMRQVVDNLPTWIKIYGSKHDVGKAVIEWFDFFNDNNDEHYQQRWSEGRPRIRLLSWLKGMRPKDMPAQ